MNTVFVSFVAFLVLSFSNCISYHSLFALLVVFYFFKCSPSLSSLYSSSCHHLIALLVHHSFSNKGASHLFSSPSEKRSSPVRFFCIFWVNCNRNRLPSLEIQKKLDRNRQKLPKTGPNQFEPVFCVFHYNQFELTKIDQN